MDKPLDRRGYPHVKGVGCSVCAHPAVRAINEALIAGTKVSVVARKFGLGDDSTRRHFNGRHWPKPASEVAAAVKAESVEQGNVLFHMAHRLRDKAIGLAQAAESRGDLRTAIAGVTSATRTLALMAEMEGSVDRSATVVNVSVTNNVAVIQTAIIQALADEPSARAKVLAALEFIEAEEVPS